MKRSKLSSDKKIVFVTISMRGGGTERVISVLTNNYLKKGKEVTILMIADDTVEYELDDRVKLHSIVGTTGGSLIGRIKRISKMRQFFKEHSDSRIISMGTVANMFTLISSIGLKLHVVISERNDPNRLNHKPIKPIVKSFRNILYRRAEKLVLQTEDVKQCFPGDICKKSVVICNPLQESMPDSGIFFEREKSVITAGRLTQQKNHKMLIDAFEGFHKKHPEYVLKIFGTGEMKDEIESYIKKKNMSEQACLCGFTNDLYAELSKGGIYVSSSDWEGISNSLIEALAMGIPTIATDCPVGGSRMCIQNGVNGILIQPSDVDALEREMVRIADDSVFAEKLAYNAVKVREEFSVEKIGLEWLK